VDPADPGYARHVLARATEYCTLEGIPWTRRLWDIGTVLALEELWEAGTWQPRKVLSSSALAWQRHQLQKLTGPDLGVGEKELRRELVALLNSGPITDPSPGHRRLRHLIDHATPGYLDRWAQALRNGTTVKPERLARTVAAHLLVLGYTAPYLATHWVTDLRKAAADTYAIVDSAAELARRPEQPFDVLLAFDKIPNRPIAEQTAGWMSSAAVVAWLRENSFATSGIRSGGGFRFRIIARDAYGAAERVRQLYERMSARSLFSRRDRGGLAALSHLWVAGHSEPLPVIGPARSADILALQYKGHLYDVHDARHAIDDALELAAPINQTSPGPAVAGAWAAVESLLSHPGDPVDEDERGGKAVAADRLAAIVACSWPRAELTTLIARHCSGNKQPLDDLARRRNECATNRDRAQLLVDEIATHGVEVLNFRGRTAWQSDVAAAERMKDMIAEPRRVLGEVRHAVQIAMRRLYRARNVVLHGGSTSSVVLDATLRTAAPLLGAGLDRIAHGHFEYGLEPLALSARAELALDLVDGETGLSVVDLLQRPGHTA
jgi:hypothetical protein